METKDLLPYALPALISIIFIIIGSRNAIMKKMKVGSLEIDFDKKKHKKTDPHLEKSQIELLELKLKDFYKLMHDAEELLIVRQTEYAEQVIKSVFYKIISYYRRSLDNTLVPDAVEKKYIVLELLCNELIRGLLKKLRESFIRNGFYRTKTSLHEESDQWRSFIKDKTSYYYNEMIYYFESKLKYTHDIDLNGTLSDLGIDQKYLFQIFDDIYTNAWRVYNEQKKEIESIETEKIKFMTVIKEGDI